MGQTELQLSSNPLRQRERERIGIENIGVSCRRRERGEREWRENLLGREIMPMKRSLSKPIFANKPGLVALFFMFMGLALFFPFFGKFLFF